MKIKDFVDEYKALGNPLAQVDFAKKHIKTKYMNYLMKVAKAEQIVQQSCYENDRFKDNTPLRKYLEHVAIIESYTDLEFNPELRMDEYDMLCECGALYSFLTTDDGKRFLDIVDMTLRDHRENYRSFAGYLDGKGEVLMSILDTLDVGEVSEGGSEF